MTYIVKATVYFNDGSFTNKKIRVKNAMSEAHAQVKLEGYFKRRYPEFEKMHVYQVMPDPFDMFGFGMPWMK
jgi:hypothetical protein